MAGHQDHGVTIVAVPAKDDRVWQLSSEKVPHLTLLFLGDKLENQDRVAGFIQHATNTMLPQFHMIVEDRGELGDKSADVLFFNKNVSSLAKQFRQHLLTDTDIFAAYQSVDQYPEWIPHLTMGYPETPAKPDNREYPGIHTVHFDRIALWTGDYEGVEFPLKTRNDEELSMSAQRRGEEFLEHYGVLGMKWGVIRDRVRSNGGGAATVKKAAPKVAKAAVKKAYAPSNDAKRTKVLMARAKLGGVRNLDNKEMQLVIRRMELEKQYKELYGERQWTTKGANWAKNFATDVLKRAATSWISNPFASGGGRRDSAWERGNQFGNVIDGEVATRAIGR